MAWSIRVPRGELFNLSLGKNGNLHCGNSLTEGVTLDNIHPQLALNGKGIRWVGALRLSGPREREQT